MTERTISVDYLARVEGEGSLKVRVRDHTLEEVQLKIFEPPRFFEAFLRGRALEEAPDITARICGICPVAYQMSSAHAIERALGVRVDGLLRRLRRLLYLGEWIESHALHIYLLHTPDFLGYPDALRLARDRPQAVQRGLALKRVGNQILEVLGGREIHPVNVRIGGFYRLPTVEEFAPLGPALDRALDLALETVRFVGGFDFPELTEDYEFAALSHPEEYPMTEGDIVTSSGTRLPQERFDEAFEELQVPYTNALHVVRRPTGASYLVGPLARYALNRERLSRRARDVAREVGLADVERNPFRSVVVRAVEVVHAVEEAREILRTYRPEGPAAVPVDRSRLPAVGAAVTEAPRGMLYHAYKLAADGRIEEARIVAPTTQNQRRIEDDIRHVVSRSLDRTDAELQALCERAIRNHDPCISCATHFLKLDVERA